MAQSTMFSVSGKKRYGVNLGTLTTYIIPESSVLEIADAVSFTGDSTILTEVVYLKSGLKRKIYSPTAKATVLTQVNT
jgi:hypothetical protein